MRREQGFAFVINERGEVHRVRGGTRPQGVLSRDANCVTLPLTERREARDG